VQALKEDQVVDPAGDVKVRGAKESEGPRRPKEGMVVGSPDGRTLKRLRTGLALNAICSQRTVAIEACTASQEKDK